MAGLRAVLHMESVARDYPGVWKLYDRLLSQREDLGGWPQWCYCPMAGAYAVVSGGGDQRVPLERGTDVARVAALAAWRPTQGIYRFPPALLQSLLETPLSGELPVEHLLRLPEWCVYVELGGALGIQGFFAHLEHDSNDGRRELRLLVDTEDRLLPVPLHLIGTLEQAVAGFLAQSQLQAATRRLPVAMPASLIAPVAKFVEPLVSVLLYLCSEAAEMRPTRDQRRTHATSPPRRGKDGELHWPPARAPEVWETGFSLGAALESAARGEGAGEGVRGHIRRAHWHSFWVGSGDARRLELRWLPPIAVKLDIPERATARNVKE